MDTAASIFSTQKRPFFIVLVLAILLNIAGIGIKFFTDDPALYALLARNMAQTNNFADLLYQGRDWLDKPHFPFWMVAVSFKLFGVSTVAYKLPALLFFFMSVLYTYKLAKKFYGADVALVAILILLTAQHVVMSNTDVRAEPYIMGLLMSSVYHFYKVKERFTWADILLASLFAACAVMTKGIYLLIPIGAAIIGDSLFKKDFKGMFSFKWLLAVILTCLFTLPEIFTLYTQFDLHPEKVVFGKNGISGIHWFLWDSQFGRFNNNGFIRNTHGSIFFFAHTLLWAFAPWMIVFFYALYKSIKAAIKGPAQPEYICLSASVLMLLIFSVSKFQLPFYTNILFPFFAIITAGFITRSAGAELKFFKITQSIISTLLLLVLIALSIVFAPEKWMISVLVFAMIIAVAYYIFRRKTTAYQPVFLVCCCVAIAVNSWFILVIYPTIVANKGDVSAAEYINQNYPNKTVVSNFVANGFHFYMQQPVVTKSVDELIKMDSTQLIFANGALPVQLKEKGIPFTIVKTFDHYASESLTLPFIIKAQRSTALKHYYIIRITK